MSCVLCILCSTSEGDLVSVGKKGIESLKHAAVCRSENDRCIHFNDGIFVHEKCRTNYVSKEKIARWISKQENSVEQTVLKRTRSNYPTENICLLCGFHLANSKIDPKDIHRVIKRETLQSLMKITELRKDSWSSEVIARINGITKLDNEAVSYHHICDVNFRTNKKKPSCVCPIGSQDFMVDKKRRIGRPEDLLKLEAFNNMCDHMENNEEIENYTMLQLCELMSTFGVEPYSCKFMKAKLMAKYGDSLIVMSSGNGIADVVCLYPSAASILKNYHANYKSTCVEEDEINILKVAAKILRSDILRMKFSMDSYEIGESLSSQAESLSVCSIKLQILLDELLTAKSSKNKIMSIGQSIMQAARPRSMIAPLQICLGVQLHSQYSSKILVEQLHALGFCSSYSEVVRFERNAALLSNTVLSVQKNSFVQHVADNADHDSCTLDGKGTFHGMAIIAAITPSVGRVTFSVPRNKVDDNSIKQAGEIPIIPHFIDKSVISRITYQKLNWEQMVDIDELFDKLWLASWFLKQPRPGWHGTMQSATMIRNHPSVSDIVFLPMIDLAASDDTTIYSTLCFIASQGVRYGFTPIVTFDQQLWWKAMLIIANSSLQCPTRNIINKLGGFHTLMSFLSSIGHFMDGSGLREVLDLIYAENTTPHLLSGKAITRAIRGHIIVESALHVVLHQNELLENSETEMGLNEFTSDTASTEKLSKTDYAELRALFDYMLEGKMGDSAQLESSSALKKLQQIQKRNVAALQEAKTAQLWLQYMEMVRLARQFIKAERTGNWKLHLQTVLDMLPYFAASGHNNYLKSGYLYVQEMIALGKTNPNVEKLFLSGLHVIRRSDRFWAGLSADLVIEQVFMRSMKTSGGFTRRTGITEIQRHVWVMCKPITSTISSLLMNLTGQQHSTSDQHKEFGNSRQHRDCSDTQKVIKFLEKSSPFKVDPKFLQSISTGVSAGLNVNVNDAKAVGSKIVEDMAGKSVAEYTPRKANQCILMTSKCQSSDRKQLNIDPALLFQRLVTIARRTVSEEADYFKYELCSHPLSLFDNNCMLRCSEKHELAKGIAKMSNYDPESKLHDNEISNSTFVVDGGSLLHKIPWQKNETFEEIFNNYSSYLGKKYGFSAIVFDGYENASTKDMAHLKRSRISGREVLFTPTMKLTTTKDEFLSCQGNKSRFIKQLGNHLELKGYEIMHAQGDADLLIVQTAIAKSKIKKTVVIGEDTDLLCLLLHYSTEIIFPVYLKSEPKKGKMGKIWEILQLKNLLGEVVCKYILFAHAILGCDTTSKPYGIGKMISLKLLKSDQFQTFAAKFYKCDVQKNDIVAAGEMAMIMIYGGPINQGINTLRYNVFQKKVSTATSFVKPQEIPPTSNALKFHSLRVYHQVQAWIGTTITYLDWGWILKDNIIFPTLTDLEPAPQQLLQIVKCSCKGDCDSQRCSCKKNGIQCSFACKNCKGTSCHNSASTVHFVEDEQ